MLAGSWALLRGRMIVDNARGDFIDNEWLQPSAGRTLRSINPADGSVVAEVLTSPAHAAPAVEAAARAYPAWAALKTEERLAALKRFARELEPRTESLARTITMEMGKPISEARIEARSLLSRINMVADHQIPQVEPWTPPGVDGECRYHPLGVIVVIGPFNFPLHLIHAHVMPALATGNTVVIKPSERAPLAAQRYVEAWAAAGLPPVLQLVQGGGDVGQALLEQPGISGVAFTGSWRTGHAIEKALIERPDVLVALEMGGQNMSIVLADADLDQAIEGSLLGGFLTTGQRCTCTSRVLVERSVADRFIERLVDAASQLTFGDPFDDVFMGPLASVGDRDHVDKLCQAAVDAGAEVLLEATGSDVGAFRSPSIHQITPDHSSAYTTDEVFGPDLAVTIVEDLDHAITVMNSSEYGLSASIFTARRAALEEVYRRTRVGCLNWNRSTNRASGAMPFGGFGKSGNFRPAGAAAVRYTTYPVQLQWNETGRLEDNPHVERAMADADPIGQLETLHRLEEACDPYGIYAEVTDGQLTMTLPQFGGDAVVQRVVAELKQRDVAVELTDRAVRVALPRPTEAGALSDALSDALYASRSVHPARFLARRPAGCVVPAGDALSLPRSEALQRRLVDGAFMPADKKPPVIDLHRSSGPYLASIDDEPLVIFDAASQIATHAAGLNPPQVVEAHWTGRFGATPIDVGDASDIQVHASRLAATLRGHADGHPYVRFCNSGGEANELAFATAATQRPGRRAIIAFEGAFHGRTMTALHGTWNPVKRAPFEIPGFEARWVALPSWDNPAIRPEEPADWLTSWGPEGTRPDPSAADDAELRADIVALLAVAEALADDQVVAVIAEPMQSEGGERYATPRFFRGLRALTAGHGVPLIMDEVQTGFHLGGPFYWYQALDLPTPPDIISCAKKCQAGAVVSRWPVPESADLHAPSLIRGQINAELLAEADLAKMTQVIGEKLCKLTGDYPDIVIHPRTLGWAFGFDLPSPKAAAFVVGQRLWRGYMLYSAGAKALRFRLNPEMGPRAIDALFERLRATFDELKAAMQAGGELPAAAKWRAGQTAGLSDLAPSWPGDPAAASSAFSVIRVDRDTWPRLRRPYEALQKATYEPARQDDFEHFTALMDDPDAVCFAIVNGQELPPKSKLVAAAVAFPLEHVNDLDGPKQDPTLGRGVTLYSADLTVAESHRGQGLGRLLKEAQIRTAIEMERADGSARYEFLTGRNRVGSTEAMAGLNARYGAYIVRRFDQQYGDPEAQTDYYRIALTSPRLPSLAQVRSSAMPAALDLASGLTRRLGDISAPRPGTDQLRAAYGRGHLNGGVINKLSLCNFVTPPLVRSFEFLRALAPSGLGHVVTASGRGEMIDKTFRTLKYHRKAGQMLVAVGPVMAGRSTGTSRSLSVAADDPDNWFGWPSVADPTLDEERCLAELKTLLSTRGEKTGDGAVLGLVIEPVYAATGRVVSDSTWQALRTLCDEHGAALIVLENTTAGFRSGRGMWRADTLPVAADIAMWFPGGQLALSFVSDAYYVAKPLTLISTWDGDEVSFARLSLELRVARQLPIAQRAASLEAALSPLGKSCGEGLFRVLAHSDPSSLIRRLAARGVVASEVEGGVAFAPPLNITAAELERLSDICRSLA